MNQKFGNARTPMAGRPPNTGGQSIYRNRPSMASGRPSMAPGDGQYSIAGGRTSSMGFRKTLLSGTAFGKHTIINVPKVRKDLKDERDLRDRAVQQAIVAKIVKFLEDCANPLPHFNYNEPKFLRNPNTFRNDFKTVFEFVFRYIQPSFQIIKLDDDVLKIMNNLGYPYNLKQSTLQQISNKLGEMLGVLEWLVEIVDIENHIHANMESQVNDTAKWELYTSCYKSLLDHRRNLQSRKANNNEVQAAPTYEQEYEAYRRSKLGDNEDEDAYDELRAQRIACEERMKVLTKRSDELKDDINQTEQNIADLKEDVKSLEKYIEDLSIKFNQQEQMMVQLNEASEFLTRNIEKLMSENQAKENLISAQRISGNEARQLMTQRQSVRDEIKMIRDRLGKAEEKIFVLQPDFYKQSAKINSDFKIIICGLCGLCRTLCNSVEKPQQIAMLDHYNFDEAFADMQKSGTDNKLVKLIEHIKELSDRKLLTYQNSVESTNQKIENLQKEIHKLQSDTENLQTKHDLEIERAKRDRNDKMRPERDFKHSMDVVKQKHKTTSETLNKFTAQLNILHEELAVKHKKYVHYKQQLEEQYGEIQSQVCDKLTKLVDRFQQIQDQKKCFKELTGDIMSQKTKEIKKFGKKGRVNKRK